MVDRGREAVPQHMTLPSPIPCSGKLMGNKNVKRGNATLTLLLYSKYFQSFPSELYAI